MPLDWMDVSPLSFNNLLLLEQVQLSWLPEWSLPKDKFKVALQANPPVEWYFRHKCPSLNGWLDELMSNRPDLNQCTSEEIRQAEIEILTSMTDLMVYAIDPAFYDAQPFLNWDSNELLSLLDFTGKTIIDVGAGTGRLTFTVAEKAAAVFAVEPVGNLRRYMREKAQAKGLHHVFTAEGLITEIPFPDHFADATMGGHVFGDFLEQEYNELARVTKPGGMIILCPGNNDKDNDIHRFLLAQGFEWSRFEEPCDGIKRKYWKTLP
jgi:2-polyprenyl-3-methyl-5-hydroxy-6-metoxy-1,4-benzoquinol methylase